MSSTTSNIRYTGKTYETLGINNGDTLTSVIEKVNSALKHIEGKTISVGKDGIDKRPEDLILEIYDRLSNLNISDIAFSFPKTGTALSYKGIEAMGLKVPVSYSVVGENYVFDFDYTVLSSLGSVTARTKYFGNSGAANRVLAENNSLTGVLNMPISSVPGMIDINVVVNTSEGDLIMTKTVSIYSVSPRKENLIFVVNDLTTSPSNGDNFNSFLIDLDKKITELSVIKDLVQKYEIPGQDNLPAQKGVLNALSTIFSFSDKLKTDIATLDKISISGAQKDFSINEAFEYVMDGYNILKNDLIEKNKQILFLTEELNSVKGFYSDIVNNLSGGGTTLVNQSTGSGGCIGAGCGGTVVIETPEEPGTNENMTTIITPDELNDSMFDKYIFLGLSFIDFYSNGCGPCVQMDPVIGYLNGYFNKDATQVRFGKINIGSNPESKTKHGVSGTPTFILFKDGVEVERYLGVNTFEFLKQKIEARI